VTSADDIWDDLFHGCAWAAYIDQAHAEHGPPDSDATRRRAYRYYEEELARKNEPRDNRVGQRNIEARLRDGQ
jgi:hypothetical protein